MNQPNLQTEFGARLLTLCDGRRGLRSGLTVELRKPVATPDEPAPRGAVLDFIASTETLDRYGEILLASGWRLDAYRRNPVFQNAHQYGDIVFTLGKALITEVRPVSASPGAPPVLFQRVEFAVDVNPMARLAYGLYQGRFLNAVSVGFIPLRWENGGADSVFRRKYLEQELLEVSAVGIPANPDALRLGLEAGAIEKGDLRELWRLLRAWLDDAKTARKPRCGPKSTFTFSRQPAGATANTRVLGGGADEAQWRRLARALRDLLKRA